MDEFVTLASLLPTGFFFDYSTVRTPLEFLMIGDFFSPPFVSRREAYALSCREFSPHGTIPATGKEDDCLSPPPPDSVSRGRQ